MLFYIGKVSIVRILFKLIWWQWFKDDNIIRVITWRTALVENKYSKSRYTARVVFWEKY
jgi:hypothetical protein